MTERIACRTPNPDKPGVTSIPAWKFDACRAAILAELADGPARASAIAQSAGRRLTGAARRDLGSLGWHMTTVRLELECRGELRRLDGTPLRIERTG